MLTRSLLNFFLLLALFCPSVFARQKAQGWCERGGQLVQINNGLTSLTKVQASYPNCTVTVYLTGTLTLATLYSDNSGTTLANPFTASALGYWSFYADSSRYDIRLSGGGISSPFTLSDVSLYDPVTAISGSFTSGRIPFATGATSLADSSGFTFNSSTSLLTVGGPVSAVNGLHQLVFAGAGFPCYRQQNTQSGSKVFEFGCLADDAAYTQPYTSLSGQFSATGTSGVITAISGTFPTSLASGSLPFIVLNGVPYPITTYNSSTSLTVFPFPPFQTNGSWAVEDYQSYQHTWYGGTNDTRSSSFEAWSNGFFTFGRPGSPARIAAQWNPIHGICSVSGNTVTRANGDFFVFGLVGRTIRINGNNYVVASYVDSGTITLTTSPSIAGFVEWVEYGLGESLPVHLGLGASGSIMDTYRTKMKISSLGAVLGANVANSTNPAVSSAFHITGSDPFPLLVGSSPINTYTMRQGEMYIDVTSNVATVTFYNNPHQRPLATATTIPHSLVAGQPITIAGATTAALNGTYTISSVSSLSCLSSGLTGTVTVSGTTVTRVTGDYFTSALVGATIRINGSAVVVASVTSAGVLELSASFVAVGTVGWAQVQDVCKLTFPTSGVSNGTYYCPASGGSACEIDLTLTSNASYVAIGYSYTSNRGVITAFDRRTATVKPMEIVQPVIIPPTSCTGMPTGTLWNNAGTAAFCP